jgi:hypothetical protein
MAQQTQKQVSGKTVRIWSEPKERLAKVIVEKAKKEQRIISEAEMVSRAVNMLCDKEEPKLGIA